MESGSTRVYVVPASGTGWQLRETATGPVLSGTATKQEGVARARTMLGGARGGEVVVLAPNGSVQRRFAVDPAPPPPWWYLRPGTARWLVPALFGLQLALRVVGWEAETAYVVLTLACLVLLAGSLVAVVRSRALDRARQPSDADPDE